MSLGLLRVAIALACLGGLSCNARPAAPARVIALDDPSEEAARAARQEPNPALVASGTDPATDSAFVYSREPRGESRGVPQLPIHINERWWPFRARELDVTEAQAKERDAQMSMKRAPPGFWDAQTALEAVSVWSVLCNECHGGRRSLDDAREMPAPAPGWGEGQGLFFGNRRTYEQMFNTVYGGGPVRETGRAEMPAWRNILSTEMIWALLYFLEYQSGGVESRFPPSLYPRRPKVLGAP